MDSRYGEVLAGTQKGMSAIVVSSLEAGNVSRQMTDIGVGESRRIWRIEPAGATNID